MKPFKKVGKFLLLLLAALTLLGTAGCDALSGSNLYDIDPYLFDQEAFQYEWNWELGFDCGYGTFAMASKDTQAFKEGYKKGLEIKEKEKQGELVLKDPTYQEMAEFLKYDVTNRRQYIMEKYMCHHFSRDTVNHAKSKGIRTGYVILDYPGVYNKTRFYAHAIICFNTIDGNLIFVEPQLDKIVKVEIGKSYNEQNNLGSHSYDDTITKIEITWADGSKTIITEN